MRKNSQKSRSRVSMQPPCANLWTPHGWVDSCYQGTPYFERPRGRGIGWIRSVYSLKIELQGTILQNRACCQKDRSRPASIDWWGKQARTKKFEMCSSEGLFTKLRSGYTGVWGKPYCYDTLMIQEGWAWAETECVYYSYSRDDEHILMSLELCRSTTYHI